MGRSCIVEEFAGHEVRGHQHGVGRAHPRGGGNLRGRAAGAAGGGGGVGDVEDHRSVAGRAAEGGGGRRVGSRFQLAHASGAAPRNVPGAVGGRREGGGALGHRRADLRFPAHLPRSADTRRAAPEIGRRGDGGGRALVGVADGGASGMLRCPGTGRERGRRHRHRFGVRQRFAVDGGDAQARDGEAGSAARRGDRPRSDRL